MWIWINTSQNIPSSVRCSSICEVRQLKVGCSTWRASRSLVNTNDQREPAVGSRWMGWVWEITGWSSRLHEITNLIRGIYRICLNLIKENRRMSACNRLDLQTLGSQLVMLKNLPNHWWIHKELKCFNGIHTMLDPSQDFAQNCTIMSL